MGKQKAQREESMVRIFAGLIALIYVLSPAASAQSPQARSDYKRGIERFKKGDLDGAIADFSSAIEINLRPGSRHHIKNDDVLILDPINATIYYNRAVARLAKSEIELARADFSRAIAINPRITGAWVGRGRCHHSLGDPRAAIADFSRAIALDDRSAIAYNNRGISRQVQDDLPGAIDDFTRAIEIDPRLAQAYLNRGAALCASGDAGRALSDLTRSIEIDNRNALAYNNRGKAWQLKGDFAHARADYDEAIALDPGFAFAYANRGLLCLLEGSEAAATRDFARALELKPGMKSGLDLLIEEIRTQKAK